MTQLGTHGVLVKTTDFPRARWLTSRGTLTQRRFHAGLSTEDEARRVAEDIAESNAGMVESARATKFWKD